MAGDKKILELKRFRADLNATMSLRRQAVMHWILSGQPGTLERLGTKLRSGQVTMPDGTKRAIHATTAMLYKDFALIKAKWASDQQYRWSKEEYREKLQRLYQTAMRDGQSATAKPMERLNAIRLCADLLRQIGQLDGMWSNTPDAGSVSPVAQLEIAELRAALDDHENANVIDVTPTKGE